MENLPSLNQRYAKAILVFLLDYPDGVMQKDLFHIVKNSATREKVLNALEKDGLVEINEYVSGRKKYNIKLTHRGQVVAKKLKEAERISKIPPEELEKYKRIHVLEHFNVYEDHVTLTDRSLEGVRYVNIYARPKGDLLYFWCDVDKEVDCYHIGYLFVDEKLRNFIKEQLKKNGFKLPKIYQKYVDEYW